MPNDVPDYIRTLNLRDHDTSRTAVGDRDMTKIEEVDIQKIKTMVEEEFPDDPALQQSHIARKIIAKKAELEGLSFLEYVKLLTEQYRKGHP